MTGVVDHLIRLGLNEYEAKAYIAAVALGEGTIKEISEESGVPRSRAYDVMERLAEKGLVTVGNTNPLYYRANEPKKATDHLMEDLKVAGDEVSRYLSDIGSRAEKRDNPIWTLKGDWAINHKVCEMIESAQTSVEIICINNKHLLRYAKCIAEASKTRSMTVVIAHQPESFIGLLGNAQVMKLNDIWKEGEGLKKGAMSEKGFTTGDGKYNLELVVECDHHDSMILSKEGDGYRAILCTGTVLSYFFRDMVQQVIDHADQIKSGIWNHAQ
jgi:HTH-type transcriptional regulator, sugar sensing transcriptional regulator